MTDFDELYRKFVERKCTRQEAEQLFAYFLTEKGDQEMADHIAHTLEEIPPAVSHSDEQAIKRNEIKLMRHIAPSKSFRKPAYTIVAVAASIVLALSFYLLLNNINGYKALNGPYRTGIDADPGSNKATLTLTDGSKISLDDAANGQLAEQAGIQVSKAADGQLVYTVVDNHNAPVATNTIATPNGGQYQVRLPDGSKVWLNAASSLKYPVSFAKQKQRIVELVGEAYFEVAHQAAQPFMVKTATQTVQVLGTHFNINSYADEERTITTLAEGSVRISSLQGIKQSLTLKPNEQAINTASNMHVQQADMRTALAWKDGNIIFTDATIEEIMRQVKRWYNVEVVYEGQIRKRVFNGGISRNSKLSVLLNVLKDSEINFELRETPQGKALIIKP